MNDPGQQALGARVVKGVLWLGAWRWTGSLLGLLNTIVIARFLVPEDLGIVATALIVTTFAETLLDLGSDRYIVRLADPVREDFDTAWTLRLLVVGGSSALLFLAAAPAAGWFGDARLASVMQVLATGNVLRGFTNIGLVIWRRDLRFDQVALVGLVQRCAGVAVTVALAVWLRNYWAIVAGEVLQRLIEVLVSYRVQPYRPRFSLSRIRAQWDFSKWVLSRNLAAFVVARGDQFAVARFYGVEPMGLYSMSLRLAEQPTRHLAAPLSMPIYAGMARLQQNPAAFAFNLGRVTGAVAAIILPAAALVALLSESLVAVLLGARWQSVDPLVAPVVLTLACAALAEPAGTALTLAGRIRWLALLDWGSALVTMAVLLALAQFVTLTQLAWARLVMVVLIWVAGNIAVAAMLRLPWSWAVRHVTRPVVASLAMAVVLRAVMAQAWEPWTTLVAGGGAGVLVYGMVSYGLWSAAGRPDSGDALVVRKLAALIARRLT